MPQRLAQRSYRSNTQRRIVAPVAALTGRVVSLQRSHIGVKALVDVYRQVAQVYADRDTICVALDGWVIHFHPEVLAALCPQPLKRLVHGPSKLAYGGRVLEHGTRICLSRGCNGLRMHPGPIRLKRCSAG